MSSDRRQQIALNINWYWATLCVILLFVAGATVLAYQKADRAQALGRGDLQCIAQYENNTRARTQVLTTLSAVDRAAQRLAVDKQSVVTRVLGDIVTQARTGRLATPAENAKFLDRLNDAIRHANIAEARYQKADDDYNRAFVLHPIPEPIFKCSARLKSAGGDATPTGAPSPDPKGTTPTKTQTVTASRAATRTVTATRTPTPSSTTVFIPGQAGTVTRTAPGATTTVTRTVTRTVAPPPCLPVPKLPCTVG